MNKNLIFLLISLILISSILKGNKFYLKSNLIQSNGKENAQTFAVLPDGDIIIAGSTNNSSLLENSDFQGATDIYLIRYDNTLSNIKYSTYLGGSGFDEPKKLKLGNDGNLYLTGHTESEDFPVAEDSFQKNYGGSEEGWYASGDIFVAKLTMELELISATYLGGQGFEYTPDLILDNNNNLYLTGHTNSENFPVKSGVFQENLRPTEGQLPSIDCFIAVLSSDLTNLITSTFLGGESIDFAEAITFDNYGDLIIGSWVNSEDFPRTTTETFNGGYYDVAITKLSADLTTLKASTFVGGVGSEFPYALAVDDENNIYFSGHTGSKATYPVTDLSFDPTYNSTYGDNVGDDVVITKLDNDLENILASTFFGGNGWENSWQLMIKNDFLYVSGTTQSGNIPTLNAYDISYNGGTRYNGDIFLAKFSKDLTTLYSSTFFGGDSNDFVEELVIQDGKLYFSGWTDSSDFPEAPEAINGQNGFMTILSEDYATDISEHNYTINSCQLDQNYPNPFNPETTITYTINKTTQVNLKILNSKGQLIKELINKTQNPGKFRIKFTSLDLNSGIYFYQLSVEKNIFTKKMILIK